ncbi:MAG: hypothetical protein RI907_1641 [Pseudomonadota bacterium]|jgi:uncharacterized membrane protein YedE/YeeE
MRRLFTAGLAGLLFGLGLIVSGMTQPAKVQGFLDLAGAWDPSLAFVMVGAISVAALGFALERRQHPAAPLGECGVPNPPRGIDRSLVLGSLTFGVGWGLAGFCPGPALVALSAGQWQAAVFVAAMLVGMVAHQVLRRDAT